MELFSPSLTVVQQHVHYVLPCRASKPRRESRLKKETTEQQHVFVCCNLRDKPHEHTCWLETPTNEVWMTQLSISQTFKYVLFLYSEF